MISPEAFTTPCAVGRLPGFSFQQLCISVYLVREGGTTPTTRLNTNTGRNIAFIQLTNSLGTPHRIFQLGGFDGQTINPQKPLTHLVGS